jgi:hypothetical protein|tara:strand:+ start:295 stop:846 length:552 start_codon:yes stop_codon:yes gene_type:complete
MSLINIFFEYIKKRNFNNWVKKKRDYTSTIQDYTETKGTIILHRDKEYLFCRTDTAQSILLGSIPTDMCLAFKNDKSRNFKNPANKWLKEFFIYSIHLINTNTSKMCETNTIGITVFKKEQPEQPNVRFHPPIQGPGQDIFYDDYEKCVIAEGLLKKYLDIPPKVFDILNSDIKEQRSVSEKL